MNIKCLNLHCFISKVRLLCHSFGGVVSLDLVCLLSSHTINFVNKKDSWVELESVWCCDINWKSSPSDLISVLLRHLRWVLVSVFMSHFLSLSLRWDVVRGGNQSPDPHAGWTAFHRSAGIRSGSRLPDVRLLPRTAGTKWLFFLSISRLLDSSQSAGRRLCQWVVLVLGFGFYSCLFLLIYLLLLFERINVKYLDSFSPLLASWR